MSKLYLANCTHQNQVVYYRIPEIPSPRQQHIAIGNQIQVSGDLNPLQIESIVTQLRKYGLVNADEIDRTRPFIGMCYSVDKPIKVDFIMRAIEHNNDVLTQLGKKMRQEAAVAANNTIEDHLQGRGRLKNFDVEIEEVPAKDGASTDFNEAVRVTRDSDPSEAAATAAARSARNKRAR